MENIMSEAEVPETGAVSVDDVLKAIQNKNLAQARSHFDDVMGIKINDALENEKVRIANSVFNGAEEEPEEPEEVADESEETEDEVDVESEVEAIFDEEEVHQE